MLFRLGKLCERRGANYFSSGTLLVGLGIPLAFVDKNLAAKNTRASRSRRLVFSSIWAGDARVCNVPRMIPLESAKTTRAAKEC